MYIITTDDSHTNSVILSLSMYIIAAAEQLKRSSQLWNSMSTDQKLEYKQQEQINRAKYYEQLNKYLRHRQDVQNELIASKNNRLHKPKHIGDERIATPPKSVQTSVVEASS